MNFRPTFKLPRHRSWMPPRCTEHTRVQFLSPQIWCYIVQINEQSNTYCEAIHLTPQLELKPQAFSCCSQICSATTLHRSAHIDVFAWVINLIDIIFRFFSPLVLALLQSPLRWLPHLQSQMDLKRKEMHGATPSRCFGVHGLLDSSFDKLLELKC